MDFVTGLPTTPRGDHSIMVVIDRLTKMVPCAIPTRQSISASDVSQISQDRVFALHGLA